jgi:hypothetical protein
MGQIFSSLIQLQNILFCGREMFAGCLRDTAFYCWYSADFDRHMGPGQDGTA